MTAHPNAEWNRHPTYGTKRKRAVGRPCWNCGNKSDPGAHFCRQCIKRIPNELWQPYVMNGVHLHRRRVLRRQIMRWLRRH